jgi:membrane protein required for colicin V production
LTLFDIIALLILAVSVLPFTGPVARAAVKPSWAANTVALLLIFLAVYILVRVLAAALTRGVHSTQTLGTVDRLIGAGFGLIRGLVFLGVFNLVFNLAPPPSGVPAWVGEAKLYPLSADCARTLLALAPKGSALAGRITPAIAHAVANQSDPATSSAIGQTDDNSYNHPGRKGLEDAVEKSR